MSTAHSLSVFAYRTGVTGLVQVNIIDVSRPKELVEQDNEMFETLCTTNYLNTYYLLCQVWGVVIELHKQLS